MIKNKWTVRIILLVTLILTGLILYINLVNSSNNIAKTDYKGIYSAILNAGQENEFSWENESGFEVNPSSIQGNGFEVPKIAGRAIYCTERGVSLAMQSNMYRGNNDAYSYYSGNSKIVSNIFNSANGNMSSRELSNDEVRKINNTPEFGLLYTIRTRGYYECGNNHTDVPAEEAYVITAYPCNEWSPRKQIVIWWLQKTGSKSWNALLDVLSEKQREYARNNKNAIEKLYYEAKAYGKYQERVAKATEHGGTYASNLTDSNNITSEYYTDNSQEYIKVGPYTMKYVNGKYKDEKIIFGGLGGKENNETLGLYVQNGNQKIKVEKIITDDTVGETKYFEPCDESNPDDVSGYYVENTTSYMRPSSEKEFYILIPKTELEADAKLYAHFTWMESKGEECVKEGISYQISDKNLTNNKKLKLINGKIEFVSVFTQQLTEYQGKRQLQEYTLELGKVQPPSKEGSYSINMRKIYEDENGVEHGLKGAEFLINGLLTRESDEEGYILSGQQIINASGTETWTVEEKSAPEGYITQPLKIVFNVYKVYNSTTNTYEVDRIEIVSSNSNAEVTFNKEDQTITVKIKNIKANPENPGDLLDTYEIKAKKVDEQGNGLAGAKFNITWPKGQTSEATSNENGDLVISGQTPMLLLNSERKDHFKIEEIEAPAGYKMIDGAIEFDVEIGKADIGKNAYVIKGIINVNAPEGVTVELNGRGEISIVVQNKKDIKLISIGGNVWEDAKTGKASLGDGINSTTNNVDKNLENIKVSLYTEDMKLAELMPDDSVTNIYNRINPTLTDSNGNYKFEGVDDSKKYYVVFEYDGQVYMPTEYLAKGISGDTIQNYNSVEEMLSELTAGNTGKENGNSGSTGGRNTETGKNTGTGNIESGKQTNSQWFEKWKANSKASELNSNTGKIGIETRNTFNERFKEIGASPKNYVSKNTLGISSYLVNEDNVYYNKSYTRLELMGYTLRKTSEGIEYIQDEEKQLVDGYKYNKYGTLQYDDNGAITSEWSEGKISKKIKEFIVKNGHYPNEAEKKSIYRSIVADMNDDEAWNKLQFIEDCKISAITKSPFVGGIEYYPTDKNTTFGTDLLTNYVNLGLWRRQEFNAQLTKDVVEVTTIYNGGAPEKVEFNGKNTAINSIKDYMNDYTKADSTTTNLAKQYADSQEGIYVNRLNSAYYYDKNYNRPIKKSEYMSQKLEVWIKYRITIYNLSQSLETQITEVVDYYDNSLELDLDSVVINSNGKNIKNSMPDNSIYGDVTEKPFPGFNKVYIRLNNKQLATGEGVTIDLTYKVKNVTLQGFEGYVNIGEKTNIAEINGYKTYYSANTSIPNRHGAIIGNNTTIAGLIDVNSTPGNLKTIDEITNGVINFEDDSDKTTATLTITDDPTPPDPDTPTDPTNIIKGCVWEDNGDGIRDSGEDRIAGVKVALCTREDKINAQLGTGEKQVDWIQRYNEKNYNKYIYKVVKEETTDQNGEYSFKDVEKDSYYVLFGYGLDDATVLTNDEDNETYKVLVERRGKNEKSYNGQDYKSTIFQAGFENGYDIENVDYDKSLNEAHVSKAIDDWARVEEVNKYSKIQTNHIAEVLASPTKVPTYLGEQYGSDLMGRLVDELTTNTWKIAKTPKIVIEERKNGETVPNVDLGLAERPKTQLQITNNVENVKVILSDGSIVFDATQTAEKSETKDVIWKSNRVATKGTMDGGFIQLYLDEELMYGATIQIMYKMQIKELNDYAEYKGLEYYAKDRTNPENKVESKAKKLVCYIPNKMQFNKEQSGDWETKDINKIIDDGLVNKNLKDTIADQPYTISTIEADNITETKLTISQLITKENSQGGYECKVEIVELENEVGRKMEKSIVGNFNSADVPKEDDEAKAEDVTVMPPFGIGQVFYYVLAIVIAGVLVIGIIFIKKKVLVK